MTARMSNRMSTPEADMNARQERLFYDADHGTTLEITHPVTSADRPPPGIACGYCGRHDPLEQHDPPPLFPVLFGGRVTAERRRRRAIERRREATARTLAYRAEGHRLGAVMLHGPNQSDAVRAVANRERLYWRRERDRLAAIGWPTTGRYPRG